MHLFSSNPCGYMDVVHVGNSEFYSNHERYLLRFDYL